MVVRVFRFLAPVALTAALLFVAMSGGAARALTLDEALALAKDTLPTYRAALLKVKSSEYQSKATLGPYYPTLDLSASERKYYSDDLGDPLATVIDLRLSQTVYDFGKRRADRDKSLATYDSDKEEARKVLYQLYRDVKVAFYSVLAARAILDERKIAVDSATKDYDVAQGRYKYGVVKLSDTLQASTRLQQSRFNQVQAEGTLVKAVADLNSLIGRPLDTGYDVVGAYFTPQSPPAKERLYGAALKRPEVKQAESAVKSADASLRGEKAKYWPTLSVNAAEQTPNNRLSNLDNLNSLNTYVGITATWNIFELGKFYRKISADFEVGVSGQRLDDSKRQAILDVQKTFEDLVTAIKSLAVAEEQLKQATQSYSQAFGEYKVGKGDILSLVQAETSLSQAREQLVTNQLNVYVARANLERVTGVERLEDIDTRAVIIPPGGVTPVSASTSEPGTKNKGRP